MTHDRQLPLNNKIIEIMATMPMMTDEAMMMMTAKENQVALQDGRFDFSINNFHVKCPSSS